MPGTILANATLVLPQEVIRGSVVVRDGLIDAIDAGTGVPAGAVDCGGDLVVPGLVELHTDNLERHIQPRPLVHWPHAAAIVAHDAELATTGITTVFDALRVGSITSGKKTNYGEYARQLADEILALRAQGALRISHFLHLRAEICSETLTEELAKFDATDRIGILSLMDHTPGQRQFRDIDQLRHHVQARQGLAGPEFDAYIAELVALSDRVADRHEAAAVIAAGRLGAVLASHDDTTPDQVARSAGHGVRIAEFPTTIEAAEACRARGIGIVMGAPNLIRGGSHSGNVSARALAESDLLDMVSSDYVPSALMSAALLLGDLWGDMARGLATVTATPATLAGLEDRGRIVPGTRADLVRVARFAGTAAVRATWVRGQRVA